MSEVPWYKQLFGEDYLRSSSRFQTPEQAPQEVEGTVRTLALPPGSRILALGCGYGRQTIPLGPPGCRMTGQDLSQFLRQPARAEAAARGIALQWVHRDMRACIWRGMFPREEHLPAAVPGRAGTSPMRTPVGGVTRRFPWLQDNMHQAFKWRCIGTCP